MNSPKEEKIEIGLQDSKIRRQLNRSFAMYNSPADGKQRLLRAVIHPSRPQKWTFRFLDTLFDFFMQTEDPESVALLQAFALSKARVFGLPGAESLHMI